MEWKTPRNVDDFKPFMGLPVYYRRFMKNFTQITYPITSLQRKGNKFEWTEECVTSFYQLKKFLTSSLVIKIIDPYKEFTGCTNACKRGLGGVLMQEGHGVCYESRKQNEHE